MSTARNSRWQRQVVDEVARGNHVIVHDSVRDLVLSGGAATAPLPALRSLLREVGYEHVASFDLADGWDGGREQDTARLRDLLPEDAQRAPADTPQATPAVARLQTTLRRQTGLDARAPAEAMTTLRALLSQRAKPLAVILPDADVLFNGHGDAGERESLARLIKGVDEAAGPDLDASVPLGNSLILLTGSLDGIPAMLRTHPRVTLVRATRPDHRERRTLLGSVEADFAAAGLTGEQRGRGLDELTLPTDGWTGHELVSLASASHTSGIGLERPRRLILRYRAGVERDPWEALDMEKLAAAREELTRQVAGQDAVLDEVVERLVAARAGARLAPPGTGTAAPRVVLFLVGTTGVGKTELAKSLARVVFGDENAVIRQDMNEFKERHAAERLGGAPPGYLGYGDGGELSERVARRPFSVVLLDEVEKAHPSVWDRLLAIIDDGRLTDGSGRTVSFADTIIVMTSNAGSSTLPEAGDGAAPPYERIRAHFVEEVRSFMERPEAQKGLGRPELYGRLEDDVLVFDVLRPEVVAGIVGKMIGWYVENVAEIHGVRLHIEPAPFAEDVAAHLGAPGTWNGRRIGRRLDRSLRRPLAPQLLAARLPRGAEPTVVLHEDGRARLIHA